MTVSSSRRPPALVTEEEREIVARQLGRPPRGLHAIAARDANGEPTVVQTWPRLENGTPFPTLYYLTSPPLVSSVETLETSGGDVK